MSGIPSWARVGAKVVCIDAEWEAVDAGCRGSLDPSLQEICTIQGVYSSLGFVYFALVGYDGADYEISGFKPLISQADDIATHFKALLDVPEQVGA